MAELSSDENIVRLSQERLKELLTYNKTTGWFTRKVCLNNRWPIGSRAGWVITAGYRVIRIDEIDIYEHQLACLYVTGKIPQKVDHKNRKRSDNRWRNLRPADDNQNAYNASLRKHNTSGFVGVTWARDENRWQAQIGFKKKVIHLGRYKNKKEAALVRDRAAIELFGSYAKLNFPRLAHAG
jgi:HNH endonuclease/AP2 domain